MESHVQGVLLVVLVLCCVGTQQAAGLDAATEAKIRTLVQHTMKCRQIPGFTLGILKDNTTWTAGFGKADLDTGRLVDEDSLFGIGSLTKAFTMVLLGGLLEEHGFSWTSKVSEVLGHEFKFTDDVRTREMTIRDLLSHRTGLARLDFALFAGYDPSKITREQVCRNLQYLPEQYPFRDQFLYNNHMYMLLGYICEKLGGATWESLVTKRIFTPVGMTSSTILTQPRDLENPNMAKPYIFDDGEFKNGTESIYQIFPSEPAGAILSSAKDMLKWARFIMNKGKTEDGTQLIKEDMLAEAFKATTAINDEHQLQKPLFPVAHVEHGYGHAWIKAFYRGYELHHHSGGLMSYVTQLWIYPDLDLGVFMSVSGPAFKSGEAELAMMYYITDTMMGETPWINATTACTFPQPWAPQPNTTSNSTDDTHPLVHGRDFVGEYTHPFMPSINVSMQNGNVDFLNADMGRVSAILHTTEIKNNFRIEVTSPWEFSSSVPDDSNVTRTISANFTREAGGNVNGLVVDFEVMVTFTKLTKGDGGSVSSGVRSVNGVMIDVMMLLQVIVVGMRLHLNA